MCKTVAIYQRPTQSLQINSALTVWYSKTILLGEQSSPLACAVLSCLNNRWKKVWRFNKYWNLFELSFSVWLPHGQAPGWSWWALLPFFDGSSSRLLPDFIYLSPYLQMEVAHAAGWHVVLASWESSKTTRWTQLPVPDFCITLFHFGSIRGVTTVPYAFTGGKKITASIKRNWLRIHLPVLEKNSYRITPCRGKKKNQGKVSFWLSLLTEAFWCWYCWLLKDLLVSWGPKHESLL